MALEPVLQIGQLGLRTASSTLCRKKVLGRHHFHIGYPNGEFPGCAQWARTGKFQLFSYGSTASNVAHYGAAEPPDIAANYSRLDIPVDIMAGTPAPLVSWCYNFPDPQRSLSGTPFSSCFLHRHNPWVGMA